MPTANNLRRLGIGLVVPVAGSGAKAPPMMAAPAVAFGTTADESRIVAEIRHAHAEGKST